ncbi:MAG: hypothetical protein HY548_08185 [Elusimicrobia bacterium]|nr:hypothetical protein [Elusimicrobiota bacterium]
MAATMIRFLFSLFFIFLTLPLVAVAPHRIYYQGKLTDAQGNPKPDGSYKMQFEIYDAATDGDSKFSESREDGIPVANGVFEVSIGACPVSCSADLRNVFRANAELWLQITVEGLPLLPRQKLNASPFALGVADDSVTSVEIANGSVMNDDINVAAAIDDDKLADIDNDNKVAPGAIAAGALPGDVIASSVASNSIQSAHITDGQIVNADIAASAAIALSKLEKNPSQIGTINTSTNPVDWSQLKNVPAGFTDGSDNIGAALVVEENDVVREDGAANMDFLGAHFNISAAPDGEANISLDGSSVTLQGNVFNGPDQLLKLSNLGYLGLGTTPEHPLDVLTTATGGFGIRSINTTALGTYSGGNFWAVTPNIPTPTDPYVNKQRLGAFHFGAKTAESTYTAGATISAYASEPWTATAAGSFLSFATAANGTVSRLERMRIDQGGDVAVLTQGKGVIFKATDGANCFRVTVNNAGSLATTQVTCP